MKKYEILLFDLDDTLIDNTENVRHAFKKVLETMGQDYAETDFIEWCNFDKHFWEEFQVGKIKVPIEYQDNKDLFVQYISSLRYVLYFDSKISIEKAFELNNLFWEGLNELVIPVDGAYETLKYLHDKYRLVIATNGPNSAVRSKLEKINCLEFISSIFSANMVPAITAKPNPKYFEFLKEHIKFFDTNKMLIIGDSLNSDILGGMNSNIDSCWFNRKKENTPEQYQPTLIIDNLIELTSKL